MTDDLTHTVRIVITGKYSHGEKAHADVTVQGDGGIDHMLQAFATALVAAGYSTGTAERLVKLEV